MTNLLNPSNGSKKLCNFRRFNLWCSIFFPLFAAGLNGNVDKETSPAKQQLIQQNSEKSQKIPVEHGIQISRGQNQKPKPSTPKSDSTGEQPPPQLPSGEEKPQEESLETEVCIEASNPKPIKDKKLAYSEVPFQPGEKARYKVYYFGAFVGYGDLYVLDPVLHKNQWVRSFATEANTGDWYKWVFIAREQAKTLSHPVDFSVQSFRISQDEGKITGKRYQRDKWLTFHHSDCKVEELTLRKDKPKPEKDVHFLRKGSIDVLGSVYKIRTMKFVKGEVTRLPVYSSAKNWWLEAIPIEEEILEVPAGKFETFKLKIRTFLGQELQQKGESFAWLATKHPQKPLVKLKGEIKIGHIDIELETFEPGKPL